jgi:hypothetical protein
MNSQVETGRIGHVVNRPPTMPCATSVATTEAMTSGPNTSIAKLPMITSITNREAPIGA